MYVSAYDEQGCGRQDFYFLFIYLFYLFIFYKFIYFYFWLLGVRRLLIAVASLAAEHGL